MTPRARAVGSIWNRVADDTSATVWPRARWACTRSQASEYSSPAISWANSRSPSSTISSSDRPASALRLSPKKRSKSSSVTTPRSPSASVWATILGSMSPRRTASLLKTVAE